MYLSPIRVLESLQKHLVNEMLFVFFCPEFSHFRYFCSSVVFILLIHSHFWKYTITFFSGQDICTNFTIENPSFEEVGGWTSYGEEVFFYTTVEASHGDWSIRVTNGGALQVFSFEEGYGKPLEAVFVLFYLQFNKFAFALYLFSPRTIIFSQSFNYCDGRI